jgi:hypothetical protein
MTTTWREFWRAFRRIGPSYDLSLSHPDPVNDEAWGSVWLHGNWRYLTSRMTTPEREHAADAVARWCAQDPDDPSEPTGLRWWRDDRLRPERPRT